MEIIFLRHRIARPGRFLHAGKHHSLVGVQRLLLRPDVPVAILRLWIAPGILEPGMLIRGVIDHYVDQHTDSALLGAMGELDKIAEGAIGRIDRIIVGDVVAVITAGRFLKRH
jgi:hypothetical protein